MSRTFPGTSGNYLAGGDPTGTLMDIGPPTITVACWFNPTSIPGSNRRIVSRWNGTNGWIITLASTGKILVTIDPVSTGADTATSATTVSVGTWYHLVLWKNGNGANALKCYINGSEDVSITSNGPLADTSNIAFYIGGRATNTELCPGTVAEVGVWNAALSVNEIAALAKGAPPWMFRPTNLAGYFPLWGVGDANEPNLSGVAYNVTETGTVTTSNHAPVRCPYPVG